MTDLTNIAWYLCATAAVVSAGWLASYAGYYFVAQHIDNPTKCLKIDPHRPARLAFLYGIAIALTACGAWMMPHWGFAVALVVYVMYKHKSGSRLRVLDEVDSMTETYIYGNALPRQTAFALADRHVALILGINAPVFAITGTTNYRYQYHLRRTGNICDLSPRGAAGPHSGSRLT